MLELVAGAIALVVDCLVSSSFLSDCDAIQLFHTPHAQQNDFVHLV